jgi:YVTN family beta-propeller protein
MRSKKTPIRCVVLLGALIAAANLAAAQTPSPALLVLLKGEGHNAMAIVDPVAGKMVGRVAIGERPHEVTVSADGKLAFATNTGGGGRTISVIDVAARKEIRRIDLGPLSHPHGIQFAGGKVYFTAEGYKAIGRYDPAGNQIDWFLGISQNRTHMLVVSKDLKIFTANGNGSGSDSISVVDASAAPPPTDWSVAVIPVGKGPEAIDLSPDSREVWTGTFLDGDVSIIDVATKKVTHTFNVHPKQVCAQARCINRLKFTPDGRRVLISGNNTGELVVLDAAARKEIKRMKLGSKVTGIEIVPDGSRAYVAAEGDDNVAVVDLKTLEVTGRISFPKGSIPDGMAWVARFPSTE